MRKIIIWTFILLFSQELTAQQNPKVVVGIVVDQMRQDYLYRFYHHFSEGGFRRLLGEGFQFKNTHYNYTPTYTAPGHASIYTGTTPAYHGIVGNNWYDRREKRSVYCVADMQVSGVGGSNINGKMSPKNLQAPTITDQLRLSTNFRSIVVGVSIKDRGAILPAGHNPTGAYWFDSKTGHFITSSYYMDQLPQWVDAFNKQKKAHSYLEQTWNTLLPMEQYKESTQDDTPYEQGFDGKQTPTFPYLLPELTTNYGAGLIRSTPFGNSLVLDFALEAIEKEGMGQDGITDFLAVSFSSTDYIGHNFGPNSVELEDTYLRLDREIKRLLDYLDEKFGDDYLVFLTSDHGVTEVPQFLMENKMIGGYLDPMDASAKLTASLNDVLGQGDWVLDVSNDQVFLNHELIKEKEKDLTEVRYIVKDMLLNMDEVAMAFAADELALKHTTDPIKKRFENGYNQKLSGDVMVNLKPGFLFSTPGKGGTSHGTGYAYDTQVPLIFYGKDIPTGQSVRQVNITDIAPTLSMLLNISLPSATIGAPLIELFE